jgi:predicted neutral ceramidase superfamily lipid hydrolase
MATRIPVSWLFLLIALAVFAFFSYHIIQASSNNEEASKLLSPMLPAGSVQDSTIAHNAAYNAVNGL